MEVKREFGTVVPPSWLPSPKPRNFKPKPTKAESPKVTSVELSNTVAARRSEGVSIPLVGQENLCIQETFLDYESLLTSVAKCLPILLVEHRSLGPVIAVCGVRYKDKDGREINISASVREGSTVPPGKHVPHLTGALREFDGTFEYGRDPNAKLYVRLYKPSELIIGTTWTNINRGPDIPERSYWYRVEDALVQYNLRHSGPVAAESTAKVTDVKFPF